MQHTRTELDALTAKALRPIAADLRIVGASRMRKDEIISAIIAAEDTDAAKSEGDIADFNEEAVYAQAENPLSACEHGTAPQQFCAGCAESKPAYAAQVSKVEEIRARVLASRAAVRVVPSPQDLPEIPEPAPGAVSIELTDGFPSVEEIKREAELMAAIDVDEPLRTALTPLPAEEYFARKTRRGTETVVVEREHGGRVDYRIIDSYTGRRSPAKYSLKAHRFSSRYVKVPS
jgi:hypothetical protein